MEKGKIEYQMEIIRTKSHSKKNIFTMIFFQDFLFQVQLY